MIDGLDDVTRELKPLIRSWIQEDVARLPEGDQLPARVRLAVRSAIADASGDGSRASHVRTRRPLGVAAFATASSLALIVGLLLVASDLVQRGPGVPGATSGRDLPPLTGPADNGLIAFERDGDIYLGDLESGEAVAIVTGPASESRPLFSPDGTRIAFHRRDGSGASGQVVSVAVNGSDERVVVPDGFSDGLGYVWAPDGASIIVNHGDHPSRRLFFAGLLSMFDSEAIEERRPLTPPLRAWPGTSYYSPFAQVAPLMEPPPGDRILSDGFGISVMDVDGSNHEILLDPSWLADRRYVWSLGPTWSPDGSRIAFTAGVPNRAYVMDADGGDVRELVSEGVAWLAWSPDGQTLAVQRTSGESAPGVAADSIIALVDLASGEECVLEATAVMFKTEGTPSAEVPASALEGCCAFFDSYRSWDYEGWAWSPDGRSILMLERRGTPPLLIDVETGEATELPWASDSAPSWQRVAVE